MSDAAAAPSLRATFSAWPLPYRLAWLGVSAIVAVFLYAATLYWGDLDQSTVNRFVRQGKILELLSAPFASDSWDRVIVLGGCIWCWWQLRPALAALPSRPNPILGIPVLLIGLVAVPATWFCYGQIGARTILLWLMYGSAVFAIAGMTLTQFGWRHLLMLKFIFAFALIAIPLPGSINNPLQNFLQQCTTTLAHAGLKVTGMDVVREGFVLRTPHGDLGVVEACCGIRSLTSLIAIAAFVSFLWNFSPLRGILLLVLSIPVIILVNGLRVVITGLLQESVGREWAAGWRHDLVGYLMVFLGLGLILLIAKMISPPADVEVTPSDIPEPSIAPSSTVGWIAAVLSISAVTAGIIGYAQPSVGRSAYPDGQSPIQGLPHSFGSWTSTDMEVEADIKNVLRCDDILQRVYRNKLGYEVNVWVIYWSTAKSVKGYHHPDICMTNRGQTIVAREDETITTPGQSSIPLTVREFATQRGAKSLVSYWTQEGKYFWTPQDEALAAGMMFPFKWIERRLGSRPPEDVDDRIVVLIGAPLSGDRQKSKKMMFDFTGQLADSLYGVCPWARPR